MSRIAKKVALVVAVGAVACRGPTESRGSRPFGTLGTVQARPGTDDEFRAYCATQPCRRNNHVVLRRADGTTYDKTFPLSPPPLAEGVLSMFPGETLHVEFEQNGNALVLSRVVASPEHPERTLTPSESTTPRKRVMSTTAASARFST